MVEYTVFFSRGDSLNLAFALKPHENARYQQVLHSLSVHELECLLDKAGINSSVSLTHMGGADFLAFSLPNDRMDALSLLFRHSCLYFAAEAENSGSLRPVKVCRSAFVPPHMPDVPKYKGKTNATFTRLLINLALCACETQTAAPLTLLDPMCGRGTALFCALTDGMNAVGLDADARSLHEGMCYMENFFKFERISFSVKRSSKTLSQGRSAPETRYSIGEKDSRRCLSFIHADARSAVPAVSKETADILCVDLPYGVQHAPTKGKTVDVLESLLAEAIPLWKAALKKGGGLSVSFNTYTLKRDLLAALLQSSGLTVLDAPYTGFEHWVEQAVSRDVLVARK